MTGATRGIASSADGTKVAFLTTGHGPSVIVIPGVLSMATDYADFARALGENFTVHTIERRGRGESGPQGDDYSILRECEDVHAVRRVTGASLLVGHSYGGLVALEVVRASRDFTKAALYEPGVSIAGSMPTSWMAGYVRKLAEGRRVAALVEFTLADAPPRIQRIPPWLLQAMLMALVVMSRRYRQMLRLLGQNLNEWREIARLDGSYRNYREASADVLLMYGGRSDSEAVDLVVERLPSVLQHCETVCFPRLDHFGIERTAPRQVAGAVKEFFLDGFGSAGQGLRDGGVSRGYPRSRPG
jgi:pimeloyl-ACP methyl ester carboxylesterase